MTTLSASAELRRIEPAHRRLIIGASLGTVIEFYDLYLFSTLSPVIAHEFFAGVDETTGLVLALLTFAAGFFVRPLGGLLFGGLGDRVGRRRAFLATIVLMGIATATVGVLPTYAQIGVGAPLLLVCLRIVQGLAIGGEYGGAVVYVTEHAPASLRGRYTGWVQTNAPLGLVLSLLVVTVTRGLTGAAFDAWGWRIPFLLSLVLVLVAVYVRLRFEESPVFEELRLREGLSATPAREALGRWSNLKTALIVVLGVQPAAAIWYCGYVYLLFFMTQVLKVETLKASILVAAAVLLTVPLSVLAGVASDRLGRKRFFVGGLLVTAVLVVPIFKGITYFTDPQRIAIAATNPVTVVADPFGCSFQLDLVGKRRFATSCDIARAAITQAGVPYKNEPASFGSVAFVRVGHTVVNSFEGASMRPAALKSATESFKSGVMRALAAAGYVNGADKLNWPVVLLLLCCLLAPIAVFYGVGATWFAESFPARIRYTSFAFAYHSGVALFGGTLPAIAFALVALTGNLYSGLWYSAVAALWSALAAAFLLRETSGRGSASAHQAAAQARDDVAGHAGGNDARSENLVSAVHDCEIE